jgi:hypothetical protein
VTQSSNDRAKPFKPSLWRKPGVGNIAVGVLFLGAGIAVTYIWQQVFWWGAMVFGGIEICIGVYKLIRGGA